MPGMRVLGGFEARGIRTEAALNRFVETWRFGLQRHVCETETLAQEHRQIDEDVLGAAHVGHFHVSTQRGEVRGDRPYVDVMEREDTFDLIAGADDLLGVEPWRCAFEQDIGRLAQE